MLLIRSFNCFLLILFFFSCKKDSIESDKDRFRDEVEQLTGLSLEASAAGQDFIEVSWEKVYSNHYKAITYTVYLNDEQIVSKLNTHKFSLIKLKPGQEYTIKVAALTKDGLKTERTLVTKTLSEDAKQIDQVLYKEYNIHSYSTIYPKNLARFADGGHLFVAHLVHPGNFLPDTFKLLVYNIDNKGNFLWYRLISALGHGIDRNIGTSHIVLHDHDKEGIVFAGTYAFKISTSNGDLLLDKDLKDTGLNEVTAVCNASPQEILVGTDKGHLLSLNANDLSVQWKQENENVSTHAVAINVDSKKNIYAAYRSEGDSPPLRIRKYNDQGKIINSIRINGAFLTGSLIIDEDENISFISSESDVHYNRLYYYKFDKAGNLTDEKRVPNAVAFAKAFLNERNEIIVHGSRFGSSLVVYGGVLTFDRNMNIKSERYYTDLPYHLLFGLTANADHSYNLFISYVQTYTYENYNFIFIKTKADGSI